MIFGGLATLTGGTNADVHSAQRLGAVVGARTYSKEFELEADQLGTVIAHRAGYNVLRGVEFFTRIPIYRFNRMLFYFIFSYLYGVFNNFTGCQ